MKFKIGDHVRIIATPCRWFDAVGTITDTAANQFHVAGIEAAPLWFGPHELILAEHQPHDAQS
ncbi:MAG: hypothetical protein M3536_10930 [Actinomycetota bacterium]|nr:hypothetical protein [Actinomycetota bacterium]